LKRFCLVPRDTQKTPVGGRLSRERKTRPCLGRRAAVIYPTVGIEKKVRGVQEEKPPPPTSHKVQRGERESWPVCPGVS